MAMVTPPKELRKRFWIMPNTTDPPILPFENQATWTTWLAEQHTQAAGVWLKLARKEAGIPSITYNEALEVALCYGWIDGQKQGFDEAFWLQKFTPRRLKSSWSKINTEKAGQLNRNCKKA
jgi:uncharacterized protein YdeI (YjbR/CyaY-like superfamily)